MIEYKRVEKSFGATSVLRGLDLAIEKSERVFVVGTSGVGKSVAIKLLIGLLRVDAGEIWFDGARIDQLKEAALAPVRRRIGMVFQNSTLFDSMTLVENVELPIRKHQRLSAKATRDEAMRRLEQVYMAEYAHRHPTELSDGMKKRAAIARTLALDPEVVLFDEPTTGLDPVSARRIDRLIQSLPMTCVVVSHDLTSILETADRVAFLYQGVVHTVATPRELRASTDPVTQAVHPGEIGRTHGNSWILSLLNKGRTIRPMMC